MTNLVASTLADRFPLKPFLVAMLGVFLLEAWGLLHLSERWGFWVLVAGYGICGGLWNMISNLAFIRFFGPAHLGEVSGFNTSITVFASAVGPAAFSLGLDFLGSYAAAVRICLVLLALLFIASIFVRQKELSRVAH